MPLMFAMFCPRLARRRRASLDEIFLKLRSEGMHLSKQIGLVAGLSLSFLCTALAQQPRGRIDVPIVIGGDKEFNACTGTGEVILLDSKRDGFLPVQSGPDRPYREIDRLFNGNKVFLCDQRGMFYAVIYSESHELTQECGVSRP